MIPFLVYHDVHGPRRQYRPRRRKLRYIATAERYRWRDSVNRMELHWGLECYHMVFRLSYHCVYPATSGAGCLLLIRRMEGCEVAYCDECVCLSARISRKPHSQSSPNFCACCLRPRLSHPSTALRYVMYFRFCEWRHVLHSGNCGASCEFLRGNSVTAKTTASVPTKFYSTQRTLRSSTLVVKFCCLYNVRTFFNRITRKRVGK